MAGSSMRPAESAKAVSHFSAMTRSVRSSGASALEKPQKVRSPAGVSIS